jgi:hypothetical protein
MKAGVVTVVGGLIVIGTVAALYFWPSSVGSRCPVLGMTAAEIAASQDQAQVGAAFDNAMSRSNCLLEDLNQVIALHLPDQLATIEILVTAPFKVDDIERWTELSAETDAVSNAAFARLEELRFADVASEE